jgi:hypothetical protein
VTCAEARHLLGAYVVGALEEGERDAVRRHLAVCPGCRREYDELAALPEYLGALTIEEVERGPVHAAPEMLDRLLAQVSAERAAGRRRRLVSLIAAAAAVFVLAVAAVGFGVGSLSGGGSDSPSQPSAVRLVGGDARTATHAVVQLQPKAWGTAMKLTLSGVPGGRRCELIAVSDDGVREVAASWTVPAGGYDEERPLVIDGAVGIPLVDLDELQVMTMQGERLVSLPA